MGDASWHVGNALQDGDERRGWIIGHFIGDGDIRHSEELEIKWGTHPKGEERAEWQSDEHRTTVVMLIRGRFRIHLDVDSSVLEHEGDYAMWGPGIGHSWCAEEDSVVLTVRWPSGGTQ
jgi:quercetin dioxygenase-like cupin family protein